MSSTPSPPVSTRSEVRATFESAKSDHLPKRYGFAARALIASARADHAEVIALLDDDPSGATKWLEAPHARHLYLALARALAAHGRTAEARRACNGGTVAARTVAWLAT